MVALRGPTTPYELKRAVARSVGYFWRFPHTQLYDEPGRLAKSGLLREEQEKGGRRRRTYTISSAGLEALRAWLSEPTSEHFQLRDIAELKLFFSELIEVDRIEALAHEQVRIHEERLALYEATQQRYRDRPALANRMIPLDLGLAFERVALAFWKQIANSPPQAQAGREQLDRVHATSFTEPSPKGRHRRPVESETVIGRQKKLATRKTHTPAP
jgi:DNA-binding PadR family transcriptional regulator